MKKNLHLITGGSRGLGAALAQWFADREDDVAEISRSGGPPYHGIKSFRFDLGGESKKEDLLKKIFESFPFLAYQAITLVNNAGMVEPVQHVKDLDEKEIAKNLAVNLTAPMALTAAFLKLTSDFKGSRSVVNISSGVVKSPQASWAAYSAAKAGLESFSQALAKDFGPDSKLRVIVFEPGVIDTEMQALIRRAKKADFNEVEHFVSLKETGQLRSPASVAAALGSLILDPQLPAFSRVSISDLQD